MSNPPSEPSPWTLQRATNILTSKGKPIKELAVLLNESSTNSSKKAPKKPSRHTSTTTAPTIDDKFVDDNTSSNLEASSSSVDGTTPLSEVPTEDDSASSVHATPKKLKRSSLGASIRRKLNAVGLNLGGKGSKSLHDQQPAALIRPRSPSAAAPTATAHPSSDPASLNGGLGIPNVVGGKGHARSRTESVIPSPTIASASAATDAARTPIVSLPIPPNTHPLPSSFSSSVANPKLKVNTDLARDKDVMQASERRQRDPSSGIAAPSPPAPNPASSSSLNRPTSTSNQPRSGKASLDVSEDASDGIQHGEVTVPHELQVGVVMTRISAKNQKQLVFRIDPDQGQIVWESKKRKIIPIETVKEIRSGSDARYYREQFQLSPIYEPRWLSLIYVVNQSNYKSLHLVAPTRELFALWDSTLKKMFAVRQELMSGIGHYEMREMMWEKLYWKSSTTDDDGIGRKDSVGAGSSGDVSAQPEGRLTFEEVEKLCRRLNINSSVEDLRRWFTQSDTKKRGYLDFEDFRKFVKCLKTRPEINRLHKKLIKEYGGSASTSNSATSATDNTNPGVFNFNVFERFMKECQKSTLSTEELETLFNSYSAELPIPLSPSISRSTTTGSQLQPSPPTPVTNTQDESTLYQYQQRNNIPPTSIPTQPSPLASSSNAIATPPSAQPVDQPTQTAQVSQVALPAPQTQRIMTVENFTSFLMSANNPALSPQDRKVWQDMTRPLCDYYISSSHNTYLVGHQLVGESTVEGYIRALLRSCRSVEVDIFDGDVEPVIFHGKTLTTKVSLREVCQAIQKYGFITSPYPIIISAEVHCGLQQQTMIANIAKEVFGESLIQAPLEGRKKIEVLPSPEELKGKIMFKTKNLFISRSGRESSWDGDSSTTTEASSSASESEGALQELQDWVYRRRGSEAKKDKEESRSFSAAIVERVQSIRKRKQTPSNAAPPTPSKTPNKATSPSPSPPPASVPPNPSLTTVLTLAQPETTGTLHPSPAAHQGPIHDASPSNAHTRSRSSSSVGAAAASLIQKAIPSSIKPRPSKPPSQSEPSQKRNSAIASPPKAGSIIVPPTARPEAPSVPSTPAVGPSSPAAVSPTMTTMATPTTSTPTTVIPSSSGQVGFPPVRTASTKPPKMSLELLTLLVYTVGVKFRGINKKEEYATEHMFSLSETSANKLIKSSYVVEAGSAGVEDGSGGEQSSVGGNIVERKSSGSGDSISTASAGKLVMGGGSGMLDLIKHNRTHLTRIYPKGTRVSSTNYEPHRHWSAGSQLVAINWQTFDLGYMLNHAMFQRNGRSGYVLKPPALSSTGSKEMLTKRTRHILHVRVISAQQLPKMKDSSGRETEKGGSADPFVEVSLFVPDWANPSGKAKKSGGGSRVNVGRVRGSSFVGGNTDASGIKNRSKQAVAGGAKERVGSTDSWVDLGAENSSISRQLHESGVLTASPSNTLSVPAAPTSSSSPPVKSILGNEHFVVSPSSTLAPISSALYPTGNAAPNGAPLLPATNPAMEGTVIPGKTTSLRTSAVKNNGFNPVWEEDLRLPFEVVGDMKELVFVKFTVRQKENSESEEALAVYCISLASLQMGYRHLPLHDAQLSQYLFSTLFVRINVQDLDI